ncbi:MAG: 4-alpha-glucanotransferase, partial [Hansschlegelia sp.]
PEAVVDASVAFLAKTPSRLVLLPLEDALAQIEQPNLPGTLDEHPNWRRRLSKPGPELLAEPAASARLATLNRRRTG